MSVRGRSGSGRAWLSGALASLLALAQSACEPAQFGNTRESEAHESDGVVRMGLTISEGVVAREVHYAVSGNGIDEIAGRIEVTDPGATLSALIGGIPPGSGYLLDVAALSDDGTATCSGTAAFDVATGEAVIVSITLVCATSGTRRSVVNGDDVHYCPALASYSAAPKMARVGETIQLSATAFVFEPDPVSFNWSTSTSTPIGTLASASTAVSFFACEQVGAQELSVTVSDGICSDLAMIDVMCAAGVQDAGPGSSANDAVSCDGGAADGRAGCDAGTL